MIVHNCKQYDDVWWLLRKGIPTASSFDRILTPTGKRSGQWDNYISELIGECICQTPNFLSEMGKRVGTPAMAAGRAAEPEARRWYRVERNVEVRQVGFCMADDRMYGCSPDGLVGEDGCLELKCPLAKTHSLYLAKGEKYEEGSPLRLPQEYKPQVHGQLIVTCRQWVDFMCYVPTLKTILVRVEPNEYTRLLSEALAEFLEKYHKRLADQCPGLTPPWMEEPEPTDPELHDGYGVGYNPHGSRTE